MLKDKTTETINFDDPFLANILFGPHECNLAQLANFSGVELTSRGSSLSVTSPNTELRERILNLTAQFYSLVKSGYELEAEDLEHGLQLLTETPTLDLQPVFGQSLSLTLPKKLVTPRGQAQRNYLNTLAKSELTFGVGPAGTGKTYLAVAMGLHLLLQRRVGRIILTRPAVEAGEKLGFLPGDLTEKINPYLRPLYDALLEMLGPQKMSSLQESGVIEIAPLAFMRGRTLNDAYIILDEAQNTTREQMKMFLTRLGFGSRAVITGDITQIDLPSHDRPRSGLIQAIKILSQVKGINFRYFTAKDVVRHPLVGKIVQAYDEYEKLSPQAN